MKFIPGSICSEGSATVTSNSKTKDIISTKLNTEDKTSIKRNDNSTLINNSKENEMLSDIELDKIFSFNKKHRRGGTIDVWWLYDDGGS